MNLSVSLRNGGGDLMTRVSATEAGLRQVYQSPTEWYGNYLRKRDWRRLMDQEGRREGDELFSPKPNTETRSPFPTYPTTTSPITLEFTARRDDGRTAFICATSTTIFRYYALDDQDILEDDLVEPDLVGTISDGIWLIIGAGFTVNGAHRWEAINVGGRSIFNNGIDLPVSYDLNEFSVNPIYELREVGVAFVGTIMEIAGVLMCMDIAVIKEDILTSVLALIGYGGFGVGQEDNYDRVHYRTMWSDPISPFRWGTVIPGSIAAGSTILTMDCEITSIQPGDVIRIIGAGVDGADFRATVGYKSATGVWILTEPVDTTVVDKPVSKWDQANLISGSFDLLDDSTPILRGVKLGDQAVIAKASGFVVAQFTGNRANPFTFERVYGSESGEDALFYRWTLIAVGKEYLLYAGKKDFYRFDLVSRVPRMHPKLMLCSNLFYDAADSSRIDEVYAADNGVTGEIWISVPWNAADCMLAFDYLFNTVSTVSELYTAAATVVKPTAAIVHSGAESWFVMAAAAATLVRYNLTLWTRRGRTYTSDLLAGLNDFGDAMNEKHLGQYMILLASQSPNAAIELNILTSRNPAEETTDMPGSPVSLPSPNTQNMVPLHMLAHLSQERIRVSGATNCRIGQRVWAVGRVGSASIQRR